MNVFDLLGYRSDRPYSNESKTSVGYFALVNGGGAQSYNLSANAGTYVVTGQVSRINKSVSLFASGGSYVINGQPATFAFAVNASHGQYALTGQSAILTAGTFYGLSANYGSYILTGKNADLVYQEAPVFVVTKGGLPKAKSTKKYKEESELRAEIEKIVKDEFDKLDGTYKPEAVEAAKQEVMPQIKQIKQIDLTQYDIAISQLNALLLQAKIKAADYEAELDDEEALLMLL